MDSWVVYTELWILPRAFLQACLAGIGSEQREKSNILAMHAEIFKQRPPVNLGKEHSEDRMQVCSGMKDGNKKGTWSTADKSRGSLTASSNQYKEVH